MDKINTRCYLPRNEINKSYLQQLEETKIEAVGLEYDKIIDKYKKETHVEDLSLTEDFKIKTNAVIFYNGATDTLPCCP